MTPRTPRTSLFGGRFLAVLLLALVQCTALKSAKHMGDAGAVNAANAPDADSTPRNTGGGGGSSGGSARGGRGGRGGVDTGGTSGGAGGASAGEGGKPSDAGGNASDAGDAAPDAMADSGTKPSCELACSGRCVSCNVPDHQDSCQPIPSGSDPDNECGPCQVCDGAGACRPVNAGESDPKGVCGTSANLDTTCGENGVCDGAGQCSYKLPVDAICNTACASNQRSTSVCSADHECKVRDQEACPTSGGAKCNSAGSDCVTHCTDDNGCSTATQFCCRSADTNLCDVTHSADSCVVKLNRGATCVDDRQCVTGHCTDGVCCTSGPCAGGCQACNIPGASLGQCTHYNDSDSVTSNDAPANRCGPFICRGCDGVADDCVNVSKDEDWHNDCATQSSSSCGTNGACDGAGACELYASTTTCSDGNACTYNDKCDGSGGCAGTSISCSDDPGTCGANRACNGTSSCTVSYPDSSISCDDGTYCNGADTCNGSGGCTNHAGDPCTSGDPCKQCNESTESCASPSGTSCEDGAFCNGTDTCNGSGGCSVHSGDPCASGGSCNICDENANSCNNADTWYDSTNNITWEITLSATNAMAWQAAVDYCNNLTRCGKSDWYLPTVSELRKLIRSCDATGTFINNDCLIINGFNSENGRNSLCDGCTANAGPDGGCYRPSQIEGTCKWHWSATSTDVSGDAWLVNFDQGDVDWFPKAGTQNVRCVRAGN